ncbi:mitochondrial 54S ribosomal protein YmL41 [Coemansia sp. RSA 1722]|nr:mitochondrial 54S ribosomal protein YmL41 [Coemansia sp. RSA 486]KAJ2223553.1 mitochondrial 54S ribosomal protein YmL41 [Coemansia sp. RSA 485]KAJ2606299.1 mitochondrial 54S ribosomal protein YmL41 [Coemansia sp. RSA 1722]
MAQRFGNLKVYFPNIVFKIIPDARLGKNQAAFRVPLNVNKLDIKDYLSHIYNVTVTDVRTTVFAGKQTTNRHTGQKDRSSRIKKAIVTIKEEFEYPKEADVDKNFGGLELKYEQMRRANKLKGWRIRPSIEMMALRAKILEGRREADAAASSQKN